MALSEYTPPETFLDAWELVAGADTVAGTAEKWGAAGNSTLDLTATALSTDPAASAPQYAASLAYDTLKTNWTDFADILPPTVSWKAVFQYDFVAGAHGLGDLDTTEGGWETGETNGMYGVGVFFNIYCASSTSIRGLSVDIHDMTFSNHQVFTQIGTTTTSAANYMVVEYDAKTGSMQFDVYQRVPAGELVSLASYNTGANGWGTDPITYPVIDFFSATIGVNPGNFIGMWIAKQKSVRRAKTRARSSRSMSSRTVSIQNESSPFREDGLKFNRVKGE